MSISTKPPSKKGEDYVEDVEPDTLRKCDFPGFAHGFCDRYFLMASAFRIHTWFSKSHNFKFSRESSKPRDRIRTNLYPRSIMLNRVRPTPLNLSVPSLSSFKNEAISTTTEHSRSFQTRS